MRSVRLFLLMLFVAAAAMALAAGCGGPATGGIGGNADSLTIRYEFRDNYFGVKPPGDLPDRQAGVAAEAAEPMDLGDLGELAEVPDFDLPVRQAGGDGEADAVPAGTFVFVFVINKNDGEQSDGGWLQGATLPNPSPLPSAAKKPEPTATTQPSPP